MREFTVITLFPDIISAYFSQGIVSKAAVENIFSLKLLNLRDFGEGAYKKCDDTLYGGGRGMLLMADPADRAMQEAQKLAQEPYYPILLSPAGKIFDQAEAQNLAAKKHLLFFCGHYEGLDARFIEKHEFKEISLGDFILTGGEAAAICVMDAVIRLLEGALPDAASHEHESFSLSPSSYNLQNTGTEVNEPGKKAVVGGKNAKEENNQARGSLLEERQYTKPAIWQGLKVPEALKSGNHALIRNWRLGDSLTRTVKYRADLPDYAAWSHDEWLLFLNHLELCENS